MVKSPYLVCMRSQKTGCAVNDLRDRCKEASLYFFKCGSSKRDHLYAATGAFALFGVGLLPVEQPMTGANAITRTTTTMMKRGFNEQREM